MQGFFPRRSRQELKKKFYREEKAHPELVKATINSKAKIPLDISLFESCLGKIENNSILNNMEEKKIIIDNSIEDNAVGVVIV